MCHHFLLIYDYLLEGKPKKAKDYLELVQSNMNTIIPIYYCKNNTANLILTSFVDKDKGVDISLTIDVILPKDFSIPETEFCSVLFNGLENAIQEASNIEEKAFKKVCLNYKIIDNRLLLFIENSFVSLCQK